MVRAAAVRSFVILGLCLSTVACSHKVAAGVPLAPKGGPVVLPAGTVLALITAETIDSTKPSAPNEYAAVISRDVTQGNQQNVLPSGSPATLVLMPISGAGAPAWQLGLSSVMLNGDSFLVRDDGKPGSPIGTFLGGVSGRSYADLLKLRPGEPAGLIVSETLLHIVPGSLLTFRLQKEITLTGSAH